MIMLTSRQEDKLRVTLFKARYKALRHDDLTNEERFVHAIAETADHRIDLTKHQGLVAEWLARFNRRSK